MSSLSVDQNFAQGFAEECHRQGLDEKEAAELLDVAVNQQWQQDPDYAAGFAQGVKSAAWYDLVNPFTPRGGAYIPGWYMHGAPSPLARIEKLRGLYSQNQNTISDIMGQVRTGGEGTSDMMRIANRIAKENRGYKADMRRYWGDHLAANRRMAREAGRMGEMKGRIQALQTQLDRRVGAQQRRLGTWAGNIDRFTGAWSRTGNLGRQLKARRSIFDRYNEAATAGLKSDQATLSRLGNLGPLITG